MSELEQVEADLDNEFLHVSVVALREAIVVQCHDQVLQHLHDKLRVGLIIKECLYVGVRGKCTSRSNHVLSDTDALVVDG